MSLFGYSFTAQAGLFTFLDGLFNSGNSSQEEKPIINSQTISLLEGVTAISGASTGGGDITIVNQNALLPDSGPLGTIADVIDRKPSQDQISIYVVRDGDNLSQIAQMFNVSVNTIIWANNLKRGQLIQPGQTLVILPVTGIKYTVKTGDTLASIAKKYGSNIDEIIEFNGLNPKEEVTAGTEIIIPNGDYAEPENSTGQTSIAQIVKPNTSSTISYTGYFMRPIDGGRKSQGLHGYNAVDFANSCGTPVVASASGDVIISRNSGWNAGYGNYVVISHPNGTQTLYAHLSRVIVTSGWHVVKGQVIGYIGATGRSTGCHVHFEVRGAKNPF